jgi:type IV secretory pathway TraG/TraD family ATPase VirD4
VLRVKSTQERKELGNVMVIGRTRCGKGLFANAQILSWSESLIANDIKRELRAQTAGFRATKGPVYTFDPTGYGDRYDPFLGKESEDDLRDMATKMLVHADEGENAIFTYRAVTMLTQLFLAARLEEKPLLPYVQSALYAGPVDTAKRLHAISKQENRYPNLATRFLDMTLADMSRRHFDDKFFISAWSNLTHRLEPIITDVVIRSLSGSDFSAKDLIMGERPATLYLCWPERALFRLAPLIRLVWCSLIDEMMDLYDNTEDTAKCWQVFNIMDEAGRSAIPMMHEYAATGVGRGLIFWMAFQSPAQVQAVYGRTNAETIWDNMDTQIYYRPPNFRTAKELREFLGDVSGYAHSVTSRDGQEASESKVEQAIALLTEQDIRKMGNDEVFVFHSNLTQIRTKRMDFRRFPHLLERKHIPAPNLPALEPVQSQLPHGFAVGDEVLQPEFVNPEQYV